MTLDSIHKTICCIRPGLCRMLEVNFREWSSLLKNPSTPLPSTLQGLKNLAIAVFWRCCLSVWMRFWATDWSYNDFFNRLGSSRKFAYTEFSEVRSPWGCAAHTALCLVVRPAGAREGV